MKQWSNKKLLKCPVCDDNYEYCHGEIASPYFRHVGKECDGFYSEPETEEHKKGKQILYEWISQQEGVSNCKLEAWIPETKQRPDIYFELNNKKYVIEFQCTPIATEFLERRELYRLANINDFWILGLEKYNLVVDKRCITHSPYYKSIEKNNNIYLDVLESKFYIKDSLVKSKLPLGLIRLEPYYGYEISNFIMENDFISLKTETVLKFIQEDVVAGSTLNDEQKKREEHREFERKLTLSIEGIISHLNEFFKNQIDNSCNFYCKDGNYPYYLKTVIFENEDIERIFFIKENCIDVCYEYQKSIVVGTGKRGGPRWGKKTLHHQIRSIEIDNLDKDTIFTCIVDFIVNYIEKYKNTYEQAQRNIQRKEEFKYILKDFLNSKIILINSSKQKVPDNIKFKFLKGFSVTDGYMTDIFVNELKFLKRKNVSEFLFMIPKYNYHFNPLGFGKYVRVNNFNNEIIKYFESYGFTNVKFLKESE